MLFNSFPFVILLLTTFTFYYLPFLKKMQIQLLIVSSLIFYGFHNPELVLLLIFSALTNAITSYLICYGNSKIKKLTAIIGVCANLAVLFFFKYSPLFAKTLLFETSSFGAFLMSIPLPIGISFFTFQGISLVFDVYSEKFFNNKETIPRSFYTYTKNVVFFISFFPQLIAGPVVKAHDFLYQIRIKNIQNIEWQSVIKSLILGYFLKMVVADNLKDFTYWIAYPYFLNQSSITLIIMLFGYSFQIFADFAGYSLIAIGLAGLFGYNLKINFNFPYIARSFKEFWKRWHISLSTFLKEYLYIPLGGNRKGRIRTYINLMITMFLGGLWHGAAWSYAVWGLFHGLALAIERLMSEFIKIPRNIFTDIISMILIFIMVTFAWLLFKLPNFNHVIEYMNAIANNFNKWDDIRIITFVPIYGAPVIIYHLVHLISIKWPAFISKEIKPVIYGIMMFLILFNSGTSGTFIYFQF